MRFISPVLGPLLAISLAVCAAPVWAHARLVRADPTPRAVLNRSPVEVRLWFSERLEAAFSTAEVLDQAGNKVSDLPARVSPADTKLLTLKLRSLSPGQYVIRYRVLSIDGHVVESKFGITVKAGPPPK